MIPNTNHTFIRTPWASPEYLQFARTYAAVTRTCLCVLIIDKVPHLKTKPATPAQ